MPEAQPVRLEILSTPGGRNSGTAKRDLNRSRLRICVLPANVRGPAALDDGMIRGPAHLTETFEHARRNVRR